MHPDKILPPDDGLFEHTPRAQQHKASSFTLAVVMAAIGAFFIAGIAAAFIYAKDTDPVQQAAAPLPPPASYQKAPAETTGSGGVK
jgi:hypothetical protein